MQPVRIAAIDIGSNSVRCSIVDVPVGGARRKLDDEKAYTRLGGGLAETGRLSDEAIGRTISALDRMLRIARHHEVTHVRAIATAAVRSAANGDEFVRLVRTRLNLRIEVISAEEEGRLAFLSAADGVGVSGPVRVVDIGGGSVEIVAATGRHIDSIASLPLGAVVLTERFGLQDVVTAEAHRRLTEEVCTMLATAIAPGSGREATLIGSGGTVTAVATLIAAVTDPGLPSVHGYVIARDRLAALVETLADSDAKSRSAIKAMPESRIDVIVAGATVLAEVVRLLGADRVVTNARGMREGIVIDTVEREHGIAASFDTMRSVRDAGRRYHADLAHAEQVRALSLALFDALAGRLGLTAGDRDLLEAAALLHDVGRHVAYERHHKHSYHLISFAELPGFSAPETRMIAAIARYHRGALPNPRHETLANLGSEERERVARLAALLRVADGLDRSRGQKVERISVESDTDRIVVRALGTGPLDVEVIRAREKADLFFRAFGLDIEIVDGASSANRPLTPPEEHR